jgi:uncharacterized protein (DUF58 family)
MIVPTSRLLIFYAVAIPPLTLLPILERAAVMPAMGAGLMFILIGLLDAAYAPTRLRGISVGLPGTVRMTKNRESSIEINLTNTQARTGTLRLGLPFPREISSPREDLFAVLPRGAQALRLLWPCTPLKRGQFHIDKCHLETKSLLGLWALRGFREVTCEIRVYPNLTGERNSLAALFLNRGGYGVHTRRQLGKGREFEKLREYIPGDGFDEIHWKATAKRRHPITKIFQIERTQEVYVIIDTSRLSARPAATKDDPHAGGRGILDVNPPAPPPKGRSLPLGLTDLAGFAEVSGRRLRVDPEGRLTNPCSKAGLGAVDSCLERFIAAALVLGLAAQKQGDLFGVLTFSDSVHAFLRARGGKSHYGACREQLFSIHPRMVNPDYEELSTFVGLNLRRRALIILLTSLDDPVLAESFMRTTDLMGRHHLVMVNMLRPTGARPVFSKPTLTSSEEIYNELSGHILWHHLREIERTLTRRGVHFTLLDHERLCVDLVSQYMNVKQRQLL